MKFEDLKKKIDNCYPIYHYFPKKEELVCSWSGMLEEVRYKAEATEEYNRYLEMGGFKTLSQEHTKITSIDNDTVKLEPIIKKKGEYEVLIGEKEEKCGGGIAHSYRGLFLHNGEIIDVDSSRVPHYYSGHCLYPEELIGIYEGCLLFVGDDAIYAINETGQETFVTGYPSMSESGKVNISIEGNELVVSEYVYYDNDHHHGGWEEDKTDLSLIKQALDTHKMENEAMQLYGTSSKEVADKVEEIEKRFRQKPFYTQREAGNLILTGKPCEDDKKTLELTVSDKDKNFEITIERKNIKLPLAIQVQKVATEFSPMTLEAMNRDEEEIGEDR